MNKYIFPIIKWKIKPWLKYYILNKSATSYPLSEITTGASPLTLSKSVRKKFNIFNVGGNTKQQSYTGSNLLPFFKGEKTRVGRTYIFENGNITITGTSTDENTYNVIDGSWARYSTGITLSQTSSILLSAGTYTISANKQSTSGILNTTLVYGDLGATGNSLTRTTFENSLTFTLESSKYVTLVIYDYNTSGTNASITGCRINTGSEAKDYEPYVGGQASPNPSYPQEIENVSGEVEVKVANGTDSTAQGYEEQTATLHLPEGMEMCEGDGFVWQNEKWYKKKVVGKVVLDGTQNISTDGATANYRRFTIAKSLFEGIGSSAISSHLQYLNSYSSDTPHFYIGTSVLYFFILEPTATVANFKTWLGTNNITIEYELATPVLEEITDPTLISDLESLKNLYSYKGTTHISSTNEPSPVFEVQYYMEEGA